MHMADALISPAVGATLWAVSGGTDRVRAKKLKGHLDDRRFP